MRHRGMWANNLLLVFTTSKYALSVQIFPRQVEWSPYAVIQGKLIHLMGPLLPNEGQAPKFAQIYLHDPEHDEEANADIRLGHMRLPAHTTSAEVSKLRIMLRSLQRRLRACNPYIKDFKMAVELQDPKMWTLVIYPNKRPSGEHERRYNAPVGFKEVNVFLADAPVDAIAPKTDRAIIVYVRNLEFDAIKDIHETHRSFDPLHFVLLFPQGENEWKWKASCIAIHI